MTTLHTAAQQALTDEQIDSAIHALDKYGHDVDIYDYGLPIYGEEHMPAMRELVRAALDTPQPLAVPSQSPAEGDAVALADGFDGWWAAHSIHRVLSPGGFARMVWEASARHNRKTVLGATDSTSGFYPEDEGSTPSGQATEVDRQLGSDHEIALMEGHRIPAMDAYFKARPSLDGPDERKAFEAGYQRGWRDSNSAHPIHPQPKGTDEPVAWMDDGTKVHNGPGHPVFRVITADTKQNMPASIQAEYTTPLYAHQAPSPAPAAELPAQSVKSEREAFDAWVLTVPYVHTPWMAWMKRAALAAQLTQAPAPGDGS